MIQAARIIGAEVGIGIVFGALILGVAKNPSLRGQLFSYAILGFAFAEATELFALMMAFLLLYVALPLGYGFILKGEGDITITTEIEVIWEVIAKPRL